MTIFWEIKPIALHGVGVHKTHLSANRILQSLCISVYIGPGGSDTLYQQAYWMPCKTGGSFNQKQTKPKNNCTQLQQ